MNGSRWLLLAVLLIAASPAPSGSFTMSPGPYAEGGTVTFTIGSITHVGHNDEVTLGVWCIKPDGSQPLLGNIGHNPYIWEWNSFGQPVGSRDLYLLVEGTGYVCTARLVEVDWFKGQPVRAWTLDEESFEVSA